METLKPLVGQLVKMIQDGTNLVKEQLPEVAEQILRYKSWETGLNAVEFVLFALFFGLLCKKLLRLVVEEKDDMDGRWFGVFLLGSCSIGCLVGVFISVEKMLLIYLAPKLYLIEFLREFFR